MGSYVCCYCRYTNKYRNKVSDLIKPDVYFTTTKGMNSKSAYLHTAPTYSLQILLKRASERLRVLEHN